MISFGARKLKPRGPPLPKRAYEISNLPKDFKISAKISDFSRFSKRFRFQRRFQDFSEDFRFREDFKISAKISDFARISAEISRFHVISGEISRFQQRFHGSQRTAYSQGTLRGAGASATECDTASARVCMREVKLREYAGLTLARVMLHRYEVQYIRACIVGPGILGLFEGLLLL